MTSLSVAGLIFGHPSGGPPYQIGSSGDLRRRFWQLQANAITLEKLGLQVRPGSFEYLHVWKYPRRPEGTCSRLLQALGDKRLRHSGGGRYGPRPILTDWVDMALSDLLAFMTGFRWWVGEKDLMIRPEVPKISPLEIIPNPHRPVPVGVHPASELRPKVLPPELVSALDRFIAEEHPVTSRPEALRLAFRDWAIEHGYLPK